MTAFPVPPLVGPSEAAAILGVSRSRVSQLVHSADFPAPVAHLAAGPVWAAEDVAAARTATPRQHPRLDLAGVAEGAELFDLDDSRFAKVTRLAGFPAPVATLKLGRVWRRPDLVDFLVRWPRRPGRPRAR